MSIAKLPCVSLNKYTHKFQDESETQPLCCYTVSYFLFCYSQLFFVIFENSDAEKKQTYNKINNHIRYYWLEVYVLESRDMREGQVFTIDSSLSK